MKKTISALAAGLLLTASLASCGSETVDDEKINVPEPPKTIATTVTTTTTTDSTAKKTTRATTTTTASCTTETATKPLNTDAASPLGKWKVSGDEDNEMADYVADSADNFDLSDLVFEFDIDNNCTIEVESDISSMMYLCDEGFWFYGILYQDIKYDGSTLTVNADGEVIDFVRSDGPDLHSKYGCYTCEFLEDDEDTPDDGFDKQKYYFDFRSSGKAYMTSSVACKYSYDAEKKIMNLMDQDDIKVEFEGNKMILISPDDSRSVFERVN